MFELKVSAVEAKLATAWKEKDEAMAAIAEAKAEAQKLREQLASHQTKGEHDT